MLIPDQNFPSGIQGQKDSGSRIRIRIEELKYRTIFNPKIVYKLSEIWSGMLIPDSDLDFLPVPDPGIQGSKNSPDPGSESATLPKYSLLLSFPRKEYRYSIC